MTAPFEQLPDRSRSARTTWLLLAMLVVLPATAFANAGTPLMWVGFTHLFIGNAVIGVAEGLLIGLVFRVSVGMSVLSMIVANYVSMLAGRVVLTWLSDPPSLDTVGAWFVSMVWMAYVVTVVIEFPFVYFAMRKARRALLWAVLATVLVNAASYAVLVAWYGRHVSLSLISQLGVVPATELPLPPGLALYTITPDGKAVDRTMAGETVRVATIPTPEQGDTLLVIRSEKGEFDLCLSRRSHPGGGAGLLLRDFSPRAPVEDGPYQVYYGETPILSLAPSSDWVYYTAFWANVGIRGENKKTGEQFRYALETPFLSWTIHHATHLPGDLVVFELGWDQVCLLDPRQKKLSLLTRGRSPVVAEAPGKAE